MLEGVYRAGEATRVDGFLFCYERRLPREEVYVTLTCGPIQAAEGILEVNDEICNIL